jgi:uncharacterized protein YqjF (DUF2071 family)
MPNNNSELPIEARLKERERPEGTLVMYQRWEELLFLHWKVAPELVQRELPAGLTVDTYDGAAWIGVGPFQMKDVRPRFLPSMGGLSNFPELNLRTYVVDSQGRPGVWFYSLDTPQPIANWIARRFFNLNYRMARFEVGQTAETLSYRSELAVEDGWDEVQHYAWTRVGQPFEAKPGSLEFFLVERYRLFAYDPRRDRLRSGQVHHVPYPVQQVKLDSLSKRLFALNDLSMPDGEPVSALASAGVDVEIFGME